MTVVTGGGGRLPSEQMIVSERRREQAACLLLGALLVLCLARGLTATNGLVVPPDLDALRDIGFTQGFLDGNWFGDPSYAGTVRYYPPLLPALMALLIRIGGISDLPGLWVQAGPFIGLLPVLAFFFFMRRLFGLTEAACGTAVFVLANGAWSDPWVSGGYSPWLLVPVVGQAAFLATAGWLPRLAARPGLSGAITAGLAIGLVFLLHPVPGMLLAAIAAAETVYRRTGWLLVAGTITALIASVYLLPMLLMQPGGLVHRAPGGWTADALRPEATMALLAANLPWVVAAAVLWRGGSRPKGALVLAAWITICLAGLGRHFMCGPDEAGPLVCRAGRMPVHHFHLYLQVAGACLIGAALPVLARHLRPILAGAAAVALLGLGVAALTNRAFDVRERDLVLFHADTHVMDVAAYRWIREQTPPGALFVTFDDTGANAPFDAGAFAVMAAGRRLMALHALFSNPYADWSAHEATRRAAAAWLMDQGPLPPGLGDSRVWAIAPGNVPIDETRALPVFATAAHRIYAVRCSTPAGCAAGH